MPSVLHFCPNWLKFAKFLWPNWQKTYESPNFMRRRKFTATERAFIIERAGGCCEYCRSPLDFSPESFEMEHILPLSKGGTNELENLALSCGGCNGRKNDKTTGVDPISKNLVSSIFEMISDAQKMPVMSEKYL